MALIHYISIAFESAIVILSLIIATKQKKTYGYGFALTFAIYVYYDLARMKLFSVNEDILKLIFVVASVSVFSSIWGIYIENRE